MTIKPILFSGPMVRAILDGRKTQTRRVADFKGCESHRVQPMRAENGMNGIWCFDCESWVNTSPMFQPGDILWVRETWCDTWPFTGEKCGEGPCYRATDEGECGAAITGQKWRPSIFMPKWACRLFLKVTGVRVLRVHEISHADCLAEGIDRCNSSSSIMAKERFQLLWDSINAKRGYGWDANPWVWVYEFKRTGKPEGWPNA